MNLFCRRNLSAVPLTLELLQEPLSAYHLYGKPGNSGENSNGTVHLGGNFPEKKVIPFKVLPFSRFYRNDRNFLYHLYGLLVQASCREKAKTLPVFCKWYNSILFLFSVPKKIPVPFDGHFSRKFPYKW